jgi:hypothetical protein
MGKDRFYDEIKIWNLERGAAKRPMMPNLSGLKNAFVAGKVRGTKLRCCRDLPISEFWVDMP